MQQLKKALQLALKMVQTQSSGFASERDAGYLDGQETAYKSIIETVEELDEYGVVIESCSVNIGRLNAIVRCLRDPATVTDTAAMADCIGEVIASLKRLRNGAETGNYDAIV